MEPFLALHVAKPCRKDTWCVPALCHCANMVKEPTVSRLRVNVPYKHAPIQLSPETSEQHKKRQTPSEDAGIDKRNRE